MEVFTASWLCCCCVLRKESNGNEILVVWVDISNKANHWDLYFLILYIKTSRAHYKNYKTQSARRVHLIWWCKNEIKNIKVYSPTNTVLYLANLAYGAAAAEFFFSSTYNQWHKSNSNNKKKL